MSPVKIATIDQLKEGEPTPFDISGQSLMAIKIDGKVIVSSRICTHRKVDLCKEGLFDKDTGYLVCTRHGSAFDLETGEALNPPANETLPVYQVTVKGQDILLTLDSTS